MLKKEAEVWFTEIPNIPAEAVERFIEEGLLSFEDLSFQDPAELAELIGVTEEEADDMIQFAEERAEQIEIEKANAPPEQQTRAPHAPLRQSPASVAAALFGDLPAGSAPSEPKPTLDSLFGPSDRAAEAAEQQETTASAVAEEEQAVATEPVAEGDGTPAPAAEEAHG